MEWSNTFEIFHRARGLFKTLNKLMAKQPWKNHPKKTQHIVRELRYLKNIYTGQMSKYKYI